MRQHKIESPNGVEIAIGDALEWSIQAWIRTSGRSVQTSRAPWLEGPVGEARIGADVYEAYAREAGLHAERDAEAGLLPDFGELASVGFDPEQVRPEVRRFYERTADYDLRLSYEWSGLLKNPPRTFIYLVGRNIQQVNLPVSPHAADVEISNELVRFVSPAGDVAPYVGWMRRMESTGEVILAGFYGTCSLPGREGKFVRGFYPLPGGSATVVFRPTNGPNGSFALVSDGKRFGEEGYYRSHRTSAGTLRVKCLPMAEVVRVFVDPKGELRAEHTFAFGGVRFLTLRYEISRRDRL